MKYGVNKDGVDHINVYSKGKTEYGKYLSNFYPCFVDVKNTGVFKTIEGYWFWLQTHDERLKTLDGYQCKILGSVLERKFLSAKSDEFKLKILSVCQQKFDKWALKDEFLLSSLPLVHYYENSSGDPDVKTSMDFILNYYDSRRIMFQLWGT